MRNEGDCSRGFATREQMIGPSIKLRKVGHFAQIPNIRYCPRIRKGVPLHRVK